MGWDEPGIKKSDHSHNPSRETGAMSDTISKLKDLKELLDGGALTQDEFDAQKAVLLGNSKITQVAPAPVVVQPGMMQTRIQASRGIPADWLAGSWTRPGDG